MKLISYLLVSWYCWISITGCQSISSSGYTPLVETKSDTLARMALQQRARDSIQLAQQWVQPGDLITRTGNDFTSESLRSLNQRNTTYSHCGLANWEHDTLFVYHALGGEFNPDQTILREPFSQFCAPETNRGFGIFRYQVPTITKNNYLGVAQGWYRQKITFDMQFNLASDDKMYCAEYVYKSLWKGAGAALHCHLSKIKDFSFVGVDDLFLHPLCYPVLERRYQ